MVGQPRRQQRVAAELEEVVVDADTLHTQHVREHLAERLLLRGPRGGAHRLRPYGGGERLAVELAVSGEWKRVQHHVGRRHHVLGQALLQVGVQRRAERLVLLAAVPVRSATTVGPGHVGDEPLVPGTVLPNHDSVVADRGVGGERRLDLGRFDAEAAQLDLGVRPGHELQRAVGAPAHQVSCPVHARPCRPVRVGNEALGGQVRPVRIAAADLLAADVQLAGHADRDGAQGGVQHIGAHVGDRAADGHVVGDGVRGPHPVVRGEDGGLGRPVTVDHDQFGAGVEDLADGRGRYHVAAGAHLPHTGEGARVLVRHEPEQAAWSTTCG